MVAFGFLVYHKMDLHERQLTQASISSTAENGAVQEEARHFKNSGLPKPANETELSTASDPLLSRTDLSDGSPFEISGMNLAEAPATTKSATEQYVTSGAGADDAEPDSHGIEDSSLPIFAFSEPLESPLDTQGAGNSGESEKAAESPREDAENRISPIDSVPVFASTDPETPSLSDSANPAATTAEPTMLAMGEPPQETGFAGGFIADDNGISARNSIVSDVVESFPSLDSANTEPPKEILIAAQEGTQFDSGFDAVTQPSSRSAHRNSIKTAAGSGSDGKFSLAAFNYQNNSAKPAPDDGSTFDSTVVQDGDNYSKISKRIYGSGRYFSALAVFNQHRIPEPKKMRPGMVVLTPPVPVLEESYPQLFLDSKAKTVEPAVFLILDDGSPAYRVGEKETLSEISERFLGRSARWIEIYRLNQSTVKDPNKLKAGLILALPADATEVNVTP